MIEDLHFLIDHKEKVENELKLIDKILSDYTDFLIKVLKKDLKSFKPELIEFDDFKTLTIKEQGVYDNNIKDKKYRRFFIMDNILVEVWFVNDINKDQWECHKDEIITLLKTPYEINFEPSVLLKFLNKLEIETQGQGCGCGCRTPNEKKEGKETLTFFIQDSLRVVNGFNQLNTFTTYRVKTNGIAPYKIENPAVVGFMDGNDILLKGITPYKGRVKITDSQGNYGFVDIFVDFNEVNLI